MSKSKVIKKNIPFSDIDAPYGVTYTFESPDGSTQGAYNTVAGWLFIEFFVLNWSVRPRVRDF